MPNFQQENHKHKNIRSDIGNNRVITYMLIFMPFRNIVKIVIFLYITAL